MNIPNASKIFATTRSNTINGTNIIKPISKAVLSSLRIYAGAEELPKVLKGLGIAIISTSKGIMTDKEARKQNIGGEVLAFVW